MDHFTLTEKFVAVRWHDNVGYGDPEWDRYEEFVGAPMIPDEGDGAWLGFHHISPGDFLVKAAADYDAEVMVLKQDEVETRFTITGQTTPLP